jgi:hypothetical protein
MARGFGSERSGGKAFGDAAVRAVNYSIEPYHPIGGVSGKRGQDVLVDFASRASVGVAQEFGDDAHIYAGDQKGRCGGVAGEVGHTGGIWRRQPGGVRQTRADRAGAGTAWVPAALMRCRCGV